MLMNGEVTETDRLRSRRGYTLRAAFASGVDTRPDSKSVLVTRFKIKIARFHF